MKKVVVVVSSQLVTYRINLTKTVTLAQEEFEGENLEVIDSSNPSGTLGKTLVIKDGGETIAVFQDWLYWKKLE